MKDVALSELEENLSRLRRGLTAFATDVA